MLDAMKNLMNNNGQNGGNTQQEAPEAENNTPKTPETEGNTPEKIEEKILICCVCQQPVKNKVCKNCGRKFL